MKTPFRPMHPAAIMAFAAVLVASAPAASGQTTVSFSLTDSVVAETVRGQSPNPGNIRITRTGGTAAALMAGYDVDGAAMPDDDCAALSGSVVIPAGASFADVVVTPVDVIAQHHVDLFAGRHGCLRNPLLPVLPSGPIWRHDAQR